MIPSHIRDAVQTLRAQGCGLRDISRALKLSRNSVRRILRAPLPAEPPPAQYGLSLAYLKSAFERAQGNVARVQQLLQAEYDLSVSYSTLTRWVRQAGLRAPPPRAGEYGFGPGEEMQHDTSPHRVPLGDRTLTAQCAGLVLAYSRRLFVQYYPRFIRFEAKQFLLEAARFMDGVRPVCLIDNTSVVLAGGPGKHVLIALPMSSREPLHHQLAQLRLRGIEAVLEAELDRAEREGSPAAELLWRLFVAEEAYRRE
jgi:hypothetical protein